MFDFEKKDLERLHQAKCKNDLDEFPIPSKYLFIYEKKMVFLSEARKKYRIYCTGNCGFEPVARTQTFDIVYFTDDFIHAVNVFKSYCARILSNELYPATNTQS